MPNLKDYQREHLFLLVGGNPLPNYVTAKLLTKFSESNAKIYLVYSNRTGNYATQLRNVLISEFNLRNDNFEMVRLEDESKPEKIKKDIADKLPPNLTDVGLNYTGGTKAMAVHAYLTIKDKYPNAYFSYLNPRKLELVFDPIPSQPEACFKLNPANDESGGLAKISLKQVLTLHGLKPREPNFYEIDYFKNPKTKSWLFDLAKALFDVSLNQTKLEEWRNFSIGILKKEIKKCENKAKSSGNFWNTYQSELKQIKIPSTNIPPNVKDKLSKLGFINSANEFDLSNYPANIKTPCPPVYYFCEWLLGKWLEDYVLQQLIELESECLLHDVGASLEPAVPGRGNEKKPYFEMDVAALRGYGECQVKDWKVKFYNLQDKTGLIDWLRNGAKELNGIKPQPIETALGVTLNVADDKRTYLELDAWFALGGSMLIRSGAKLGNAGNAQPDSVHLRSNRWEQDSNNQPKKISKPIVSGTSLAGVLRHRAVKICNTLRDNSGENFVEKMFGVDMEELRKRNKQNGTDDQPFASRLEVGETVIKDTTDLVQTRIKIDRFTGGAYEGALFDAAPVFSDGEQEAVNIKLKLRDAKSYEIGLLLLLLKDLWTSDLPVGGESSIGRGRLKGKTACLYYKNGSGSWHTNLERVNERKVKIDGIENNAEKIVILNKFVDDFNQRLNTQAEPRP